MINVKKHIVIFFTIILASTAFSFKEVHEVSASQKIHLTTYLPSELKNKNFNNGVASVYTTKETIGMKWKSNKTTLLLDVAETVTKHMSSDQTIYTIIGKVYSNASAYKYGEIRTFYFVNDGGKYYFAGLRKNSNKMPYTFNTGKMNELLFK